MQARWVMVGMFVVVGAYWLAMVLLFALGVAAEWLPYGVYALAAFCAGALMVAHAPLRPWREPAAAAVLAIAVVAALAIVGSGSAADWVIARALRPWYVGLGVAAASGAMAAAGGFVVRRIATATARTNLIVLLSTLVITGIIGLLVVAADTSIPALMAGVAAGGFITQAVIAPKRPWACGAGGGVLTLLALAGTGWEGGVDHIASAVLGGLIFVLIGYGGARLAWRFLLRGDAPPSPDLPPARLG